MVEVMQPTPADRICDPAAGTGGFLFTAYNYVLQKFGRDLDADQKRALREELVEAMELSPKVGRMCAMNLYLHGIGGDKVVVHSGHDSLAAPWSREYTMILANPPFGKSQSVLFVNEAGDTEKDDAVVVREDFWTETSNKQLNFVQHMFSLLKIDGRAAVVLPDNVLFEGGAGEMHQREPTWSEANPDGRWRSYTLDEIQKRDKLSLDLFWIKDQSLTDTDALPPPDVIAAEIAEELEAAFDLFSKIAKRLPSSSG